MKVKVLYNFKDLQDNVHRYEGDIFECSKERADYLLEHKAVEIIEEIQPKKIVEVVDGKEVKTDIDKLSTKDFEKGIKDNLDKEKKHKKKKK